MLRGGCGRVRTRVTGDHVYIYYSQSLRIHTWALPPPLLRHSTPAPGHCLHHCSPRWLQAQVQKPRHLVKRFPKGVIESGPEDGVVADASDQQQEVVSPRDELQEKWRGGGGSRKEREERWGDEGGGEATAERAQREWVGHRGDGLRPARWTLGTHGAQEGVRHVRRGRCEAGHACDEGVGFHVVNRDDRDAVACGHLPGLPDAHVEAQGEPRADGDSHGAQVRSGDARLAQGLVHDCEEVIEQVLRLR